MKKWLTIIAAAGLLLYPFAAFAEDYGSQPSQNQQAPPVAQTLVREGDFAVKLAAELKLGNPTDETIAEDTLVKAGVAPLSGWISDYPMTPVIVGQLQDAIASATAQGTLPMNSDEATKGLLSVAAQMNLPVPAPAGAGATPPQGTQPAPGQQNPNDIDQYYYDTGPPVVTYYPPPYSYAYLYDWVPYPTFWFGFWYPGFYICHNFTTVVVVDGHHHGEHHGEHWRHGVVSNHVVDPVTKRVAFVDPVMRTGTGVVRAGTTLRTENGERFRNLSDMRRGVSMSGFRGSTPGSTANRIANRGFGSPEARRGAQAIYSRSLEKMRTNGIREGKRTFEGPRNIGGERRYSAPSAPERPFTAPSREGERRSYVPDRIYRSSAVNPATRPTAMRQGGEPSRSFTRPSVPSYSGARQSVPMNHASRSSWGSNWHTSGGFTNYGRR